MSDERDNRVVDLVFRAREQLEPIRTDTLHAHGMTDLATRISAARVAIDHASRLTKQHERWGQDAERNMARYQFLLRKMFTADDEYGTGFYNTDKWREAYDALRAEIGMEQK